MSIAEEPVIGGKSFTAVAINTASKAGEWIKSKFGQHIQIDVKMNHADLVTEVDKGAEQLIKKLILTHFPDHAFLGEESISIDSLSSLDDIIKEQSSDYLWIVDPIDGTSNYIHGFPFFCVSIALAYKGEVIVGVIYDPIRDEMFVAEKGKGAYVHGKKLQVALENQLCDSIISFCYPTEFERAMPQSLKNLVHVAPLVHSIRSTGSSALDLAYLAAGRITGFWHLNLKCWDLAAGSLLVQEAGGKITDINGEPYQLKYRDVVASNNNIHEALLKELKASLN